MGSRFSAEGREQVASGQDSVRCDVFIDFGETSCSSACIDWSDSSILRLRSREERSASSSWFTCASP